MGKLSLLKECVKLLVVEALADHPKQALRLNGPFVKSKYEGDYTIYREIPMVATPELAQAINLCGHSDCAQHPDLALECITQSGEVENGVLWGENEITIDADIYYSKGSRGSFYQPPDPEEFLVEDFTIESFNGFKLSPEDAATLKDYVGELTDKEVENIREQWADDFPEPDYDPY